MPFPRDEHLLVLATRSADKVREIRDILRSRADIRLVGLDDVGSPPAEEEEAIEAFDTFYENAMAKAMYFADRAGLPALADDSGLVVHALGGEPGVRSKRFSGRLDLSGAELDRSNNRLLLDRLAGIPPEQRTAHYICVAALALPGRRPVLATIGTCAGIIADSPRGTGGFGYDPLFLLPDLGVTFAEVSPDVKNRRSHRARAFRAMAAALGGLRSWG